MIKLAVSPGDPAGIGPDICIKAFGQNKNLNFTPVIFGDVDLFQERAQNLEVDVQVKEFKGQETLDDSSFWILPYPLEMKVEPGKPDPSYGDYLMKVLREATNLTLNKEFDALVTGPLNKELINKAGISFFGHTEVLAEISDTSKVLMMLTCDNLKIALATTHVPLSEVPKLITYEHLCECLTILNNDLQNKWGCSNPCIKVLGLNPHAGDGGYLGKEDQEVIAPAIEYLKTKGLNLIGPVSADTAFIGKNSEHIDAYLAMYHDQGLPVLKTVGFGNSVNITLGLPFIRTSVDHGTAYDMAGKKEVDENSLLEASSLAFNLATRN
ncbi:MAG: 4-hydroxythreonine-4-phosphate dehydrogenase PdxA [SAR86 cluster bacterium]|jgi:4-hydroxythreonine-4-phosphate dehydrogenase|nr:4-hydroxythreonine-4-phosphate dehydrogenase PdxA [SAR86 cluster bacterium]|tara:strand:+ start:414 stop:1388 length:975 start_codon:yes stop_codon:yes gene_type:complete